MSKKNSNGNGNGRKRVAGDYEVIVKHVDTKLGEQLPLVQGAWGFNLETDQKCVKPTIRTIGNDPFELVRLSFNVLDYAHKEGNTRKYVVAPISQATTQ